MGVGVEGLQKKVRKNSLRSIEASSTGFLCDLHSMIDKQGNICKRIWSQSIMDVRKHKTLVIAEEYREHHFLGAVVLDTC
jgi:hypothetical protein